MGLNVNMMGGGTIFRKNSKYPQCKIFNCKRSRGSKQLCCFFCDVKEQCSDPCLNNPEKCKMCVMPLTEEEEKEMKDALVMDLPDAPDIARAERTGLRPGEKYCDDVICPICGMECYTIYKDIDNDVCGCENCIRRMDANEWESEAKDE